MILLLAEIKFSVNDDGLDHRILSKSIDTLPDSTLGHDVLQLRRITEPVISQRSSVWYEPRVSSSSKDKKSGRGVSNKGWMAAFAEHCGINVGDFVNIVEASDARLWIYWSV